MPTREFDCREARERVLRAPLAAQKVVVVPKQPEARVRLEIPGPDRMRETELRLDGPAVVAQIDELVGVVFAGRHGDGEARPQGRCRLAARSTSFTVPVKSPRVYGSARNALAECPKRLNVRPTLTAAAFNSASTSSTGTRRGCAIRDYEQEESESWHDNVS